MQRGRRTPDKNFAQNRRVSFIMFDTEKFIAEVHTRECIWNVNIKEYSDRKLRRLAWEEIASIMYEDWETYGTKKKNETIQELQKKWKHLRANFVREKNKESNMKSGSGATKKRKTPFLDMLQFLISSRPSNTTISNVQPPSSHSPESNSSFNINEDSVDSLDNSSEVSSASKTSRKAKGLSLFQETLLNSMKKQEENNMNPHLNFLLSLLPDMQTMSEKQLFEFKFEVMKVMQKIKYSDNYYNIYEAGPSSSACQPRYGYNSVGYGYTSSSSTYGNQPQPNSFPPQQYRNSSSPLQSDTNNPLASSSSNSNIFQESATIDEQSESESIEDIERIMRGG